MENEILTVSCTDGAPLPSGSVLQTSWQSRLRAAGYAGALELGAMLIACAKTSTEISVTVRSPAGPDEDWIAYRGDEAREFEGDSPEEAVAKLMIEHPELWRKCPR